jgi:hypothetical protein
MLKLKRSENPNGKDHENDLSEECPTKLKILKSVEKCLALSQFNTAALLLESIGLSINDPNIHLQFKGLKSTTRRKLYSDMNMAMVIGRNFTTKEHLSNFVKMENQRMKNLNKDLKD